MKRLSAMLLALVTVFALCACGQTAVPADDTAPAETAEGEPAEGETAASEPETAASAAE